MKLLFEIKDSKAEFIMELLNNFSLVKAKQISASKARAIENLKDAADEMKMVKNRK